MKYYAHVFSLFIIAFFHTTVVANEIHDAINHEEQDLAIQLIQQASRDNPTTLNELDANGKAPIHLAIQKGFINVVQALEKSGANINILNNRQESPVMLAHRLKNGSIQDFLLLEGAHFDYASLGRYLHTPRHQVQNVDQQAKAFLDVLRMVIKTKAVDAKHLYTLIYTYPLFINDTTLFTELIELSKNEKFHSAIRRLVYLLAQAGYPNGADEFETASAVFGELINTVGSSPELHKTAAKEIDGAIERRDSSEKGLQSPYMPNNGENIDWHKWTALEIAQAITLRDVRLVRTIGIQQIKLHLKDPLLAQPIVALTNCFTNTAHWFAFQIVSTKDNKIRRKLVEKLIDVAWNLRELGNYFGAMQLLAALDMSATSRLYSELLVGKQHLSNLAELKKLLAMTSAFKNYRDDILVREQKTLPCIALFSVTLFDLVHTFESITAAIKNNQLTIDFLEPVGKTIRAFIDHQKATNYEQFRSRKLNIKINFFSGLELFDIEVISEFSNLLLPWKNLLRSAAPDDKPLSEWNTSQFVYWLMHHNLEKHVELTLHAGIHNGRRLTQMLHDGANTCDKIILLYKKGLPYHVAAALVALVEKHVPSTTCPQSWGVLDIAHWLSDSVAAFAKLLYADLWDGASLIRELKPLPTEDERKQFLMKFGISIWKAMFFVNLAFPKYQLDDSL